MSLLSYLLVGLLAYYFVRMVRRLPASTPGNREPPPGPRAPTTINPQDIQDAEFRDVED